jgi:peptidoglycan/xylan/chitin deacetylase (PgdA/CDA1 family)
MDDYRIQINLIDIYIKSICFTWDDNSIGHYNLIAPLFQSHKIRCTFYINPGENDFKMDLSRRYFNLYQQGFEIGSHGYIHNHYSTLSRSDFEKQMVDAICYMKKYYNFYPSTFAFPHHDYNNEMLKTAKKYHLETRNTLNESIRISIKTNNTAVDLYDTMNEFLIDNNTVIFSGHSVIHNKIEKNESYEPTLHVVLENLLSMVVSQYEKIQVLTFEQAALKNFILHESRIENGHCYLTQKQVNYLTSVGMPLNKIIGII